MNIKSMLKSIFLKNDAKIFIKKHRYVNCSKNKIIKLKYLYDIEKLNIKYNCHISTSTKIGKNISFPHGLCGIFTSAGAKIGDNCVIFQQVTIGSNTLKDSSKQGSPIIGDNCYIGAGAKIIGKIKIGNNVRIGANCVVVKDVPDNSTVILGESKIILHNTPRNNRYYCYKELLGEK